MSQANDLTVPFGQLSDADKAVVLLAAKRLCPDHANHTIHGEEVRCTNARRQLVTLHVGDVRKQIIDADLVDPDAKPAKAEAKPATTDAKTTTQPASK